AEAADDGQEERVVEREHAEVLLARLARGPGGEALDVAEQDGEILRPLRGAEQLHDVLHGAPRICSSASCAATRGLHPIICARRPSCCCCSVCGSDAIDCRTRMAS